MSDSEAFVIRARGTNHFLTAPRNAARKFTPILSNAFLWSSRELAQDFINKNLDIPCDVVELAPVTSKHQWLQVARNFNK